MSVVKVSNLSTEPVPVDVVSGGFSGSVVVSSGTIAVSNLPTTQPVSGSVSVSNFPSTQPVSGSVSVVGAVSVSSGSVSVSNFPGLQQVENFTGHNTLTVANSLSIYANGILASSFSPVITGTGVFTSSIMTGPSANGIYRIKGKLTIPAFATSFGTLFVFLFFGENNSISYYPGTPTVSGNTVTCGTNADRSYTPTVVVCNANQDEFDDYDFFYNHTSGNPIYFYYCAISTYNVTAYCTNTVSFSLLP